MQAICGKWARASNACLQNVRAAMKIEQRATENMRK